MIAYVVMQPWTTEVLLDDGSWGDSERYEQRIEVFSCRVRANRRAVKYQDVAVCPWELPSTEAGLEDSHEPPTPPMSSESPAADVPVPFAPFWLDSGDPTASRLKLSRTR